MAVCIALAGPDGVGKSTVAEELKALLLHRREHDATPYRTVRIRHFPTDALTQCAKEDGRAPAAEDYMLDMENWLAFRPEPVRFPDEPPRPKNAQPDTMYILDRWVLSTLVYAALRGELIRGTAMTTAAWLQRIPLTTFVLIPTDPAALTDPDFGSDNMTANPYDPGAVAEGYRKALATAFVGGFSSRYTPIEVDRAADTPHSTAVRIAEWIGFLQAKGL